MTAQRNLLWKWGGEYLRERGVENARLEAELLLLRGSGIGRADLYSHPEAGVESMGEESYRELIQRRGRREPLFYLLGEREFWSLPLRVDPRALIPRPETELLVEVAVEIFQGGEAGKRDEVIRILDLGTGSGAIALALLTEIPDARVWAVDMSPGAVNLAKENARRLGLEERIYFREGDLFDPVKEKKVFFDLIVCNPPYIPARELEELEPEIANFEPRIALDGGEDGLQMIQRVAREAAQYLSWPGYLVMEFGDGQEEEVQRIFSGAGGYQEGKIRPDLSGRGRVLRVARRKGNFY